MHVKKQLVSCSGHSVSTRVLVIGYLMLEFLARFCCWLVQMRKAVVELSTITCCVRYSQFPLSLLSKKCGDLFGKFLSGVQEHKRTIKQCFLVTPEMTPLSDTKLRVTGLEVVPPYNPRFFLGRVKFSKDLRFSSENILKKKTPKIYTE